MIIKYENKLLVKIKYGCRGGIKVGGAEIEMRKRNK